MEYRLPEYMGYPELIRRRAEAETRMEIAIAAIDRDDLIIQTINEVIDETLNPRGYESPESNGGI